MFPAPTDLHAVFTKGESVVTGPDLDVEAKIKIPCSRRQPKSSRQSVTVRYLARGTDITRSFKGTII